MPLKKPSPTARRLQWPHQWWLTSLTVVCLLTSYQAHAQSPLSEGTRLLEQGQFEKALELLLPEYANAPDAVLAYTIARCYEGLKDDPRALRFYSSALSMRRGLTREEAKRTKRRRRAIKKRLRKRPKKGTLTVTSEATGAVIRLDGVEIGRSPLTGLLVRPGPHRLRLEHPNWEAWDTRFTVNAYESITLHAKMRDKPTDVLIHTEPAGAKAKISGTDIACVTPCLVPLRRGTYQLMIMRPGYDPVVHELKKEPGMLKEVRLKLTKGGMPATPPAGIAPTPRVVPPSGQGIIQLDITPPGAQVAVNNILRGTSPLVAPITAAPGIAKVVISLPGYETWTAQVQVTSGNTTALRVQLVPGNSQSTEESVMPAATSNANDTNGDRTTGWALLGTGIAVSVGGALMVALPTILNERAINLATRFQIQGQQYISSVTRQQALDLEQEAKVWSYVGYGAIGVGVGLIIGGAVLVSQNQHMSDTLAGTNPVVSLTPVFIPGGGGASATWRF
ncbi:MAG: PEGA domain-containing protein [Myxococcota bacterium]|nr:PEGA domain-containing protein [Myxococcota bacterium]